MYVTLVSCKFSGYSSDMTGILGPLLGPSPNAKKLIHADVTFSSYMWSWWTKVTVICVMTDVRLI